MGSAGFGTNDRRLFEAWCDGRTGFPIIDAGMRELNTTGFMHNRVRMITASFLVKDLHLDWQWGERFFAQHLVDYDPAVNNGSWQWSASKSPQWVAAARQRKLPVTWEARSRAWPVEPTKSSWIIPRGSQSP